MENKTKLIDFFPSFAFLMMPSFFLLLHLLVRVPFLNPSQLDAFYLFRYLVWFDFMPQIITQIKKVRRKHWLVNV